MGGASSPRLAVDSGASNTMAGGTDSRFSPRPALWRFDSDGATRCSHGGGVSTAAVPRFALGGPPFREADRWAAAQTPRGGARLGIWDPGPRTMHRRPTWGFALPP